MIGPQAIHLFIRTLLQGVRYNLHIVDTILLQSIVIDKMENKIKLMTLSNSLTIFNNYPPSILDSQRYLYTFSNFYSYSNKLLHSIINRF